jgi:GH15 family glucan-1,4-alpha-glucosidase
VRTLAIPFDWQGAVIRSAITLKLCTYEDTGAVLAALTTSIPESPGSQRNWDYRYCWLRDSYFVIQALNRLGATRTMEAYLHFIDHIVARSSVGELQPLYGISGDPQADERTVGTLPGYRGIGPVRVGNSAATQIQHDVYGSVILATTQLYFDERLVSAGDAALFERLERLGDRATRYTSCRTLVRGNFAVASRRTRFRRPCRGRLRSTGADRRAHWSGRICGSLAQCGRWHA